MWSQNLGVNCKLENAEMKTVLDRRSKGDYQVCRAAWLGDYVDPMTFMELFYSKNPMDDSKYVNPAYDALVEQSFKEPDPAKRMDLLRQMEQLQ